jgi:hypothetical protein
MKRLLMMTAGAVALLAANEANARLQLSISANGSTFSCFDGQLGCDQSGGANNLLVINTTVGGAFVEIALAQSAFGAPNSLELSSSSIRNVSGAPITIHLVAGDTNFAGPVSFIRDSGSLTFNNAVGSGASSLSFFADKANTQGANPLNTPGVLLETVTGTPTTNPDSFAGSNLAAFSTLGLFSMTESSSLALRSGGSITGFNQSMESGVPEPKTWAMLIVGFGLMALMGVRKARKDRLAPAI